MKVVAEELALLKIPKDWLPLFVCLSVGVKRGIMWWQEVTGSQYCLAPAWHRLMDALTTMDPYIEDGRLKLWV